MKIVIDIPEGFYEEVRKDPSVLAPPFLSCEKVGEIIANGKPLPKGHGRLIDADALIKYVEALPKEANGYSKVYDEAMITGMIENADVIIEADKEG